MTQPVLFSIVMIAVFALVAGGVRTVIRGDRLRGVLMIVAAAVLMGNLLIWVVPL